MVLDHIDMSFNSLINPNPESSCYMIDSYNINWNYGLLPQTWEDPSLANKDVEGAFGDNDPGISPYMVIVLTILEYFCPFWS